MGKNLMPKIILIVVLVIAGISLLFAGAVSSIYIAGRIRMWILTKDMTGGTSLVYEIDARGLSEEEKKELSRKMIAVLRRRIDPRGLLPVVWQPLSNTRLEIRISPAAGPSAPQDIQRMLKGAGILEFRILPTDDQPDLDTDEITRQVELLKTKGPKFASNASKGKYVWCEIENFNEWKVPASIVSQFGEKYFVLASNQTNEILLHSLEDPRAWKLERSYSVTDEMGRRAVGFSLNDKGGILFGKLTGNNIDRPLCILLDGMAISAPSINERIGSSGIIKGNFTQTEVEDILNKLNAGCLPARLIEEPISIETIGPSVNQRKPDQSTEIEGNMSKE